MDQEIQVEEIPTDYLVRISNKNQNILDGSNAQQLNLIRQYFERLNRVSPNRKYVLRKIIKEVVSGQAKYSHKRKEIIQQEKDVAAGKVGAVIVEKLDRLSRDDIFLLQYPRFLKKHGCEFHEVESGKLDLRKREHRFSHNFKAFMSTEYIEDLSHKKKTKNKAAMFFSGKDVSTSPILGLDPHPQFACKYVHNQIEEPQVKDMVNFFIESGKGYKRTADYGNSKGYRTKFKMIKESIDENGVRIPAKPVGGKLLTAKYVRTLFNSPKARGIGYFFDENDEYVDHRDESGMVQFKYAHPPIISVEQAAQIDHIQSLSKKHYSPNDDFLLAGVLEYEGGLVIRANSSLSEKKKGVKKKYKYYEVVFLDGTKKLIPVDLIEVPVIDRLKEYVRSNEIISDLFKSSVFSEDEISALSKKITESKALLKSRKLDLDNFNMNLTQIMSDPGFSKKALMSLLDNKSNLEIKISSENETLISLEKMYERKCDKNSDKKFKNSLNVFVKSFDLMLDCDKKRIVQSLFPRIVVEKESKLRIFLNPAFEGQDNLNSDKSSDLKWRERRDSNPRPSA